MTLASGLKTGHQTAAHRLARYRSEFPIFRDQIYLNTCSLGALGDRTRKKATEFLDLWQARGAAAWYDVWWAALSELRERYGRVIGAGSEEIALAPGGCGVHRVLSIGPENALDLFCVPGFSECNG